MNKATRAGLGATAAIVLVGSAIALLSLLTGGENGGTSLLKSTAAAFVSQPAVSAPPSTAFSSAIFSLPSSEAQEESSEASQQKSSSSRESKPAESSAPTSKEVSSQTSAAPSTPSAVSTVSTPTAAELRDQSWSSKMAILNDQTAFNAMLATPEHDFWDDEEFWSENARLLEYRLAQANPSSAASSAASQTSAVTVSDTSGLTQAQRIAKLKSDRVSTRYNGVVTTESYYDTVLLIVANELSPDYTDTCLIVQIVSTYTFLRYHAGYTTLPPTAHLAPERVQSERWGTAGMARLRALVDEYCGYMLFIDGHPILSTYGSMTNGTTNYIGDVWATDGKDGYGTPYTYLAGGVDSHWDLARKGYASAFSLSSAQVKNSLENYFGITLGADASGWLKITGYNAFGYVLTVSIDGQTTTSGKTLRSSVFCSSDYPTGYFLRSASFTVTYNAVTDAFDFSVTGYGHGVGLSQEGAEGMALEGYNWQQILLHYFPGSTLVSYQ